METFNNKKQVSYAIKNWCCTLEINIISYLLLYFIGLLLVLDILNEILYEKDATCTQKFFPG